jgi:hypothetical protein
MIEVSKETGSDVYVLETGDCGAARLQMQDEIYGSSTRQMMLDAGLKAGMRVLACMRHGHHVLLDCDAGGTDGGHGRGRYQSRPIGICEGAGCAQ